MGAWLSKCASPEDAGGASARADTSAARQPATAERQTTTNGRGLFLLERAAAGSLPLCESPLVAIPSPGCSALLCQQCGRAAGRLDAHLRAALGPSAGVDPALAAAPNAAACDGCGAVYCSTACRAKDARLHCLLCPAASEASAAHAQLLALASEAEQLFLPLAARAVCTMAIEACHQTGGKPFLSHSTHFPPHMPHTHSS